MTRNLFIGEDMDIPRGFPRLVFALYLAVGLATLVVLTVAAVSPVVHNIFTPYAIAVGNFILIFADGSYSLRKGKSGLLYAEACRNSPWAAPALCLFHAFMTVVLTFWAGEHLAENITDPLFYVLCFLPVILSAFVWWLFAATGMLFSWIFRRE